MLEATGLRAGYGRIEVLHGVSFALARGEVMALLGANGAGKTTALRTISAVIPRRSGEVLLAGKPIPQRAELVAAAGVAHVPQGRMIFADLTVTENLLAATAHLGPRQAKQSVADVMARFPLLEELAGRRGGLLSGGEQQMLALGRAITARPSVVMIDELSLGLAPKIIAGYVDILRDLATEGTSVLVVEQYTAFARKLASHLVVMARGEVVFDGRFADVDDARLEAMYLGRAVPV